MQLVVQAPNVAIKEPGSRSEEELEVFVVLGMPHEPEMDEDVAILLLGEVLNSGEQLAREVVLPASRQITHLLLQIEEDGVAALEQRLTLDGKATAQLLGSQLSTDFVALVR